MKILLLALLFPVISHADHLLKVAVLDTGFMSKHKNSVRLCDSGHKDFTGEGLNDTHGHGTNIIGLIDKNAGKANFCIINIKVFSRKGINSLENVIAGLEYVKTLNVDIVNLSFGGLLPNGREKQAIHRLINTGVQVVASAGNFGDNLDKKCNFFPACYDSRIIVIGNLASTSNYGKVVDKVIDGENKKALGLSLSGTSQSTAIYTGKLLKGTIQ